MGKKKDKRKKIKVGGVGVSGVTRHSLATGVGLKKKEKRKMEKREV